MKNRRASLLSITLILLPLALGWLGGAPAATLAQAAALAAAENGDAWQKDLAAWRAQRGHEVAAPDGWLTLVGLEWLKPGFNSFGVATDNQIQVRAKAPEHMGMFTVSGTTGNKSVGAKAKVGAPAAAIKPIIQLLAPAGGFPPDLTIDGHPAREGPLAIDARPSTIAWHGLTLAVLPRGDRFALRIKDADAPTRTAFHGLNWYAPDPRFRVTARWTPFNPPHVERIPTVIGTVLELPAPGVAEFTLNGKTLQLEPVIEASEPGTLFFILRDQTSATTTYGAARYLHSGLPDHGLTRPGELTLDFNRLENPPCAYTPYATCPLPPEQNRLPVALEAGEQRYAH